MAKEEPKEKLELISNNFSVNNEPEPKAKRGGRGQKLAAIAAVAIMGGAAVLGAAKLQHDDFSAIDYDSEFDVHEHPMPPWIDANLQDAFESADLIYVDNPDAPVIPDDIASIVSTDYVMNQLNNSQFASFYHNNFVKISDKAFTAQELKKYKITDEDLNKYNNILKQEPDDMTHFIKSALQTLDSQSGKTLLCLALQKADNTLLNFAPHMLETFESNMEDLSKVENSSIDTYLAYFLCLNEDQRQVIQNDPNYNFDNINVYDTLHFVKTQAAYYKEFYEGQNYDKKLTNLCMREIHKATSQEELSELNDLHTFLDSSRSYVELLLNEDIVYGLHVNKTFKNAGDLYDLYNFKDAFALDDKYSDFKNGAKNYFDYSLNAFNSFKHVLNQGENICDKMQAFYQFYDEVIENYNDHKILDFTFYDTDINFVSYLRDTALYAENNIPLKVMTPWQDLHQWFGTLKIDDARNAMNLLLDKATNFEQNYDKIINNIISDGLYHDSLGDIYMATFFTINMAPEKIAEVGVKYFDLDKENARSEVVSMLWNKFLESGGYTEVKLNENAIIQAEVPQNFQAGEVLLPDESLRAPEIAAAQRVDGNEYLFELKNLDGAKEIEYSMNGERGKISMDDYLAMGGILVDFASTGNFNFTARAVVEKDGKTVVSEYGKPQRLSYGETEKNYYEALKSNIEDFLTKVKSDKNNPEILDAQYAKDEFKIVTREGEKQKTYTVDLSKHEITRNADNIFDLAIVSAGLVSAVNNGKNYKVDDASIVKAQDVMDSNALFARYKSKYDDKSKTADAPGKVLIKTNN